MKKKKIVVKVKKTVKKTKPAVKKKVKKTIKPQIIKKKVLKPAVKALKKAKRTVAAKKTAKSAKTKEIMLKEAVDLPQQVEWILKCLNDRKSEDIRLFDVSATAGLWEYYVVCSGASSVHVSALRDNLKKEMGEKGFFKSHEDRDPDSKWIVVDFGDILVHIFDKETRIRFALETTLGSTELSIKNILKD